MRFLRADSVAHACALLAEDPDGSKVIAGGTALVLMLKQGLVAPERLVSVGDLHELHGVEVTDDAVLLRGATSLTDAAAHPTVLAELPALAGALASVGNVRIRNAATVAGNLAEADYASDPPAALIALGAQVVVAGPAGQRSIPVAELITGFYTTVLAPDELIVAVRVPRVAARRSAYLKFRTRSTEDRPCVGVAASVTAAADGTVADLAVVVGAVAPRPQWLPEVTADVVGARLDAAAIADVAARYAEGIDAMDDHRGSSWYRRRMIEVHVRRALEGLAVSPEGGQRP